MLPSKDQCGNCPLPPQLSAVNINVKPKELRTGYGTDFGAVLSLRPQQEGRGGESGVGGDDSCDVFSWKAITVVEVRVRTGISLFEPCLTMYKTCVCVREGVRERIND